MHSPAFIEVNTDDLIADVALLAREIWEEHYIPIIGPAQVEYMLERFQSGPAISQQIREGYNYFLICGIGDRYLGYLGVLVKDEELRLHKIYLHSDERGKGYGRCAIEFVTGLARTHGCSRIMLTVNKNNARSIKVYERCGFNITGPVIRDIGNGFVMDDYLMEKEV